MSDSHGVTTGRGHDRGSRFLEPRGRSGGIGYLERDAESWAHLSADFDLVDHALLRGIGELERSSTGVEDHHSLTVLAVDRLLDLETQGVTIERERGVEILDLDDEAKLSNRILWVR